MWSLPHQPCPCVSWWLPQQLQPTQLLLFFYLQSSLALAALLFLQTCQQLEFFVAKGGTSQAGVIGANYQSIIVPIHLGIFQQECLVQLRLFLWLLFKISNVTGFVMLS